MLKKGNKSILLPCLKTLFILLFSWLALHSFGQEPPNTVVVDLSDSPTASYTVVDIARLSGSFPCGDEIEYPDGGTNYAPGTDVCVNFKVLLHPASAGISVLFEDGATPSSSTWGVNCEQSSPIDEAFCLEPGNIVYYLSYCKPGSGSTNTISFESLPNPDIFYTGACTSICPDILYIGEGFSTYTIESTESDPTLQDEYESYLSCYPNCADISVDIENSVEILPSGDFPSSVEYQITGTLTGYESPCINDISSNQQFTISLYDTLEYDIMPEYGVYACCDYKDHLNLEINSTTGGFPFNDGSGDYYEYTWFDALNASGSQVKYETGTSSYLRITGPGDYSVEIKDNNPNCDPKIVNFPVKTETELPVELISMDVSCQQGSAEIEWTTATEYNNDHFVLEKSSDLHTFTEVARLQSPGFSLQPIKYNYTDHSWSPEDKYYRLKQVDFDGSQTVIATEPMQCDGLNSEKGFVHVYENPCHNNLNIKLENTRHNSVEIILYDSHGKVVYAKTGTAECLFRIDMSKYDPGLYVLKTQTNKALYMNKIVKR